MARFETLSVGKLTITKEAGHSDFGAPSSVSTRAYVQMLITGDVPDAGDVVVVGGVTYTWGAAAAVTAAAGSTFSGGVMTGATVLIGASEAASALNFLKAINASGTAGTTYSTGLVANTKVFAVLSTHTAAGDSVLLVARQPGSAGNALTVSDTATEIVWYTEKGGSTVATTLGGGRDGNDKLDADTYTNITGYGGTITATAAYGGTAGTGAVAAVTINTTNMCDFKGVTLFQYNTTEQTILKPVPSYHGLQIGGDIVDAEALQIHLGIDPGSKHVYQVGPDGNLVFRAKLKIGLTAAALDLLQVGWRKAEATVADWNNQTQLAAVSMNAGVWSTDVILDDAATSTTATTDTAWGDGEEHEIMVTVGMDGSVGYYIDGSAVTVSNATTMLFKGGELITPFINILHDASPGQVYLRELECGQKLV